jgi:hypothetical protein
MSTALALTRRLPLFSLLLGALSIAPLARPVAVPVQDEFGLGGSMRITW